MSEHWTEQEEMGGGGWQFRLVLRLFRLVGPRFVALITRPIVFFMYLGAGERRRYSAEFLAKARAFSESASPARISVFRHFQSFASTLVDKMAAWAGNLNLDDIIISEDGDFDRLLEDLQQGQGVLALCSHLGNIEVLRALGSRDVADGQDIPDFRVIAVVEFDGTAKYNDMLEAIDISSMEGIIPVSEIGPETIIRLREFIESGGMVVIAGDRTTPGDGSRRLTMDFFGSPADFPYGSFFLADLLESPVYTVFALRENERSLAAKYRYVVDRAPVRMGGGRKGREARIGVLASFFRNRLEELAAAYPYQWFNFYRFWN